MPRFRNFAPREEDFTDRLPRPRPTPRIPNQGGRADVDPNISRGNDPTPAMIEKMKRSGGVFGRPRATTKEEREREIKKIIRQMDSRQRRR